jgi:hypothetical protein
MIHLNMLENFNISLSRTRFMAMSLTEPASFQTLLQPYETLVNFRAKLQTCKHQLTVLSEEVPSFLPAAAEWIAMANGLLDRITPEIQQMDFQLLTVLQIQLQYSIDQLGHLPTMEAD